MFFGFSAGRLRLLGGVDGMDTENAMYACSKTLPNSLQDEPTGVFNLRHDFGGVEPCSFGDPKVC